MVLRVGKTQNLKKGSVEFSILFLRLWTHLEAFENLQNLFEGFCKTPFFSECIKKMLSTGKSDNSFHRVGN
jgi:hypothetical protein